MRMFWGDTIALASLHDLPNNHVKSVEEEIEDIDTARFPATESFDVREINFLRTDVAEIS